MKENIRELEHKSKGCNMQTNIPETKEGTGYN